MCHDKRSAVPTALVSSNDSLRLNAVDDAGERHVSAVRVVAVAVDSGVALPDEKEGTDCRAVVLDEPLSEGAMRQAVGVVLSVGCVVVEDPGPTTNTMTEGQCTFTERTGTHECEKLSVVFESHVRHDLVQLLSKVIQKTDTGVTGDVRLPVSQGGARSVSNRIRLPDIVHICQGIMHPVPENLRFALCQVS